MVTPAVAVPASCQPVGNENVEEEDEGYAGQFRQAENIVTEERVEVDEG